MPIVTISGIPVYQALVDDEGTGMIRISLVDDPAVQSNFLAFAADRKPMLYSIQDEEKRLVLGVVMRADFPIYRRDAADFEYYVIYSADTIRKMAEKYLAENRQNIVSLMHRDGSDVEGVQMVQYFIKGKGVNPDGFGDIADGSLFAEFHVTNDDVWAEIKDGTYKGFSLEGIFDLIPETDKESVEKIVDTLDGKFNNETPTNKRNMSKLAKIRAALQKVLATFGSVTTDKGVLAWDGDEDLKAGDGVFIEDQDGNRTEAADGDYRTEDGKTIVVENGQVAEIRDPEAEVAPEEGQTGREEETVDASRVDRFARICTAFEATYEEKTRKIVGAIAEKLGHENFWVAEAADDYAVIAQWSEDSYETVYRRFPVSWGEDDSVTVGDGEDVKLMFVPLDYESPFEDGRGAEEVEALRQENETLRAQVAQMEASPAAKPAHEEVTEVADAFRKTGNKGLDNLARMMAAK